MLSAEGAGSARGVNLLCIVLGVAGSTGFSAICFGFLCLVVVFLVGCWFSLALLTFHRCSGQQVQFAGWLVLSSPAALQFMHESGSSGMFPVSVCIAEFELVWDWVWWLLSCSSPHSLQ